LRGNESFIELEKSHESVISKVELRVQQPTHIEGSFGLTFSPEYIVVYWVELLNVQ